jgi:hypothetical protein
MDDWPLDHLLQLRPGNCLIVRGTEEIAGEGTGALSGTNVFLRPAAAINARTLSAPASLNAISVAVLSLRVIMASSVVRSETMPVRFGGLNVGLPNDQTVSSSASFVSSRVLTTPGESTWRNASQRTKVLIALAMNNILPELDWIRSPDLSPTAGANIFRALSPGKASNRLIVSAGVTAVSRVSAAAASGIEDKVVVAAAVFKKSRLERAILAPFSSLVIDVLRA